MGHGQFGGTALPDERLAELRQLLLLQEEQDRLGALEKRYTDPASLAEDISRVVAEAIHTRAQRDRAIQLVLEPVLEDVLRIAVNRNPKLLADALFPVIGEAVRKAVGRALRGLVESLNQIVERRFSLQSLQWRWEAWSTGKSFGEIVLLRSLTYSVEQVFLVHRETGLLLQHAARDQQVIRDTDMVSGMLTAIQDFVHDSFGHANDHLETMQVGDLSVWIQHGPLAMLAGVVSGTPPPELRGVFQTVLEEIHAAYRAELAGFQGDTGDLAGTAAFLQRCFPGQSKQAPRQSWLWLWIPAIILIAPIAGAVLWARSHRQWEDFEARLRREPGIVLTSVEEHRGRHEISGLRDPLATDPKSLMRSSGIDTEKVDLHLQPYLSLDPQFVEIRRKLAEKDTLERQIIRFPVNSAHIEAAQIRMIDTAESAIRQLLQSRQKFTIEIRGHADATGAEKKNLPLSQQRAEAVRVAMLTRGIPAALMNVVALGSSEPQRSQGDMDSNRRAEFRVLEPEAPR